MHNPIGITIGSAIFARMTTECHYRPTLQRAALPPHNCPFPRGSRIPSHILKYCTTFTTLIKRLNTIKSTITQYRNNYFHNMIHSHTGNENTARHDCITKNNRNQITESTAMIHSFTPYTTHNNSYCTINSSHAFNAPQ